jgi:hypothetical protein
VLARQGGDVGLSSSAGRVRIGVLGTTTVTVNGASVHLTPGTVRLLLRLVAAEGEAVLASQLYVDMWPTPPYGGVGRGERNDVQKRVLELRRKIAPGVVVTERVLTAPHHQSAYRLAMGREQLDYLEFEDLANQAVHAPPATAVDLLARALALWRGAPFSDITGYGFAAPLAIRMAALHKSARADLAGNLAAIGRVDAALRTAENLATDFPDDPGAARLLSSLREQMRSKHTGDVLWREFPGLHVEVVVRTGDLFDQDDANLVIGFGDTFDTETKNDAIISRGSTQGQLIDRLYAGDRKRLDADLESGLRRTEPTTVESRQAKPRGKRRRYPVGTVVPLPLDGRKVFAVAHCRQDLDLMTSTTAAELRSALEQVWRTARQHGLLKPVAIPLIGAGLARATETYRRGSEDVKALNREQLLIMIIDTFLESCQDSRCAPELRIIVRPSQVERIQMQEVARFVGALDRGGRSHD